MARPRLAKGAQTQQGPPWGFPTDRTEEELGMGLETLSSTLGPEASRGASVTL